MREELRRIRALPACIRGRKVVADVAKPGGAEKGIGDCMQNDVGIAVPGEPPVVGYRNAAQHDWTFARESVNIETHSRSRRQSTGEPLLGPLEIGGQSDFLER